MKVISAPSKPCGQDLYLPTIRPRGHSGMSLPMKLALSKASIFLVLLVGYTEIRPTKPVTQESGLAGVRRELLESETVPALEREINFNDIDGVRAIKSATWLGDKLVALSTRATDKGPVHLLTFTPRTLELSSSQQILPEGRTGPIFFAQRPIICDERFRNSPTGQ